MSANEYPETRAKPSLPAEDVVPDAFDASIPKPPGYLNARAKRIFAEMAETLSVAGVLRTADRWMLAQCAQMAADVERLTKEVRKEGEVTKGPNGGDVYNPKVGILRDKAKSLRDLCDRLGLSPKARAALTFPEDSAPPIPGNEDAQPDQMEMLIDEQNKLVRGQFWRQPGATATAAAGTQEQTGD